MDDDADHDPAVAPGGAVAAGAVAVVVPGRAMQLWAGAVPEGVVDRQHDRRAGGDQHRGDEVQQDQAELVSRAQASIPVTVRWPGQARNPPTSAWKVRIVG